MSKPRPHDFTKFYFDKVATGEGCGCAERVIDTHEFDRLAGRSLRVSPRLGLPTRKGVRRFLQKAGLWSRPKNSQRGAELTKRHGMQRQNKELD